MQGTSLLIQRELDSNLWHVAQKGRQEASIEAAQPSALVYTLCCLQDGAKACQTLLYHMATITKVHSLKDSIGLLASRASQV